MARIRTQTKRRAAYRMIHLEPLEQRQVLTTTLFLDFGLSFPVAGLTVSDGEMADPGINGPSVFGASHTLQSLATTITNRNLDVDGDGTVNGADAQAFADRVELVIERIFEPFDILVQQASATSIANIRDSLAANGNGAGNRDAYIIGAGIDPPANPAFGWARVDFTDGNANGVRDPGEAANNQDNLGFAFADAIISSLNSFTIEQLTRAVGRTMAHEAGHTFGLVHTRAADNLLVAEGDLMGTPFDLNGDGDINDANEDQRDFSVVQLLTRFDLPLQDTPAVTQNAFDILADGGVVGLRAGAAAFVTGTGAFDTIRVVNGGGGNADVTVTAYTSADRTTSIGTESYSIPLANGILIEGGLRDDVIQIDASIASSLEIRGGEGSDRLEVFGTGTQNATYTPDGEASDAGAVIVSGGAQIHFEQFEPVVINAMANLNFVSPNSADNLTIDSPAPGQNRIRGTSDGVAFEEVTFFDVTSVLVDMATNDGGNPVDSLFMANAGLIATGLTNLTVNGGAGNDLFEVFPSPAVTLRINGGAPVVGDVGVPPGDRLFVRNAFGATAPINSPNGTILIPGAGPIVYTSIESLVLPDRFESNNTLATATNLGSEPTTILNGLSILGDLDQSDLDFFKITAHDTGALIVRAYFSAPAGDLDLDILDRDGNVIATGQVNADGKFLTIPVVGQQMYFIRMSGAPEVANNYSLEIENFPAPVPTAVTLDPATDSGMMNNDGVTNSASPLIFVHVDLSDFQAGGVTLLNAADLLAGATPGAGILLRVVDTATGATTQVAADPVDPFGNLWSVALPLAEGRYSITATTRIVDGQAVNATGQSGVSPPLLLTVDRTADGAIAPQLLEASDSGTFNNDGVTNIRRPAFSGTTAAGSKIQVFARNVATGVNQQVGSGVAGPTTGDWEITIEPLADGAYDLTIVLEDLAGNRSNPSDPTRVVIDTAVPNTPYLDLISDDGISTTDNITSVVRPVMSFTVNDTLNGNGNPFPNDLKFRLYVRPDGGLNFDEILVVDSELLFAGLTDLGFLSRIVTLTLNDTTGTPYPNGVHGFKLEVEDRAGNISPDFLLNVEFDSDAPIANPPDLIDSSDTGMSFIDNVTNKMEPAFNAVSEAEARVTLFAQPLDAAGNPVGANAIVGTGFVGSDATDGVLGNGLGIWEITSEPLDDGAYLITALIEDLAGGRVVTPALQIVVDTVAPNTPFLDLVSTSDTGRDDTDEVTRDNTPTVTVTANDTLDGNGNPFPNDLKYRLYVRPDGDLGIDERLLVDSFAALGDFTTLGFFTHTLSLTLNSGLGPVIPDGVHNLKLEVEDRAGNISADFLLEIAIDTVAPAIPTLFLDPSSDSGVQVDRPTLTDRATHDTDPKFFGRTEADAVVRLAANGVFAGLATAAPQDGNDAFVDGQWNLTTTIDLNDPASFALRDGLRSMTATSEDLAGNLSGVANLPIFIDTQGARIFDIRINDVNNPFNLFALKPNTEGPTPLVNALVLRVSDLPNRAAGFLYDAVVEAIAEDVALYQLIGDHNGIIPIANVTFTQDPDPAVAGQASTGFITLTFNRPLPDDRFTLKVSEKVVDPVGNKLQDVDGGFFLRRFTVDSRPEVGTWAGGSVYLDTNGNFILDPENSADDANEDLVFEFGLPSDDVFAGNFVASPVGIADGFDKLAAYGDVSGPASGLGFRWRIDFDNDGIPDLDVLDPANVNGLPAAGRFDANDVNGDEVGIFTGREWRFDTDHDFRVDRTLVSQLRGYPIVGDFNADGFDDLATYNEELDRFEFDLTTGARGSWDGVIDRTAAFGFAGVRERPAAADMDQDGIDDFGLWVPDRSGVTAIETGEWFIFVSGGDSILDRIVLDPALNVPSLRFNTEPFANDLYAAFGDEFALPLLGNFDPPIDATTGLTNPLNPLDVNGDTFVSPLDALLVINQLGANPVSPHSALQMFYDTNADGAISPIDALLVINALSGSTGSRAASAAEVTGIDDVFAAEVPDENGAHEDPFWRGAAPALPGLSETPRDRAAFAARVGEARSKPLSRR